MATLTQSQIYTIALMTGMKQPRVMAAIAMAESSGRTDVVNSIGCVGLWQINQPVHVKANPKWTQAWLKNPFNNAFAAKKIYASQGLRAWEVYTNGMYAKYLDKVVTPDTQAVSQTQQAGFDWKDPFGVWPEWMDPYLKGPLDEWFGDEETDEFEVPGNATAEDLEAVAEGVLGLAEAAQKAGAWLSHSENWVRVAYVAGGGLLALLALLSIARPAVTKVVPQAKALSKLTKG